MTDHTPGPWTYTDERMPNDDARGFWVAAPGSWHVAEVLNEADARLIAAAPDLLAALEDAEKQLSAVLDANVNHAHADPCGLPGCEGLCDSEYHDFHTHVGDGGVTEESVQPIRAAIANAKGEVSVDE